MSYTPTTWSAGDTITATKLNKMEQGIAGGGGFYQITEEDGVLSATWQEIHDALQSGMFCTIRNEYEEQGYSSVSVKIIFNAAYIGLDDIYGVSTWRMGSEDGLDTSDQFFYTTQSANGYPENAG